MLVLASSSPRRIDMLRTVGISHQVHPVDIDETPKPGEDPSTLVLRLSQSKADAAAPFYPGQPLLGADTMVVAQNSILGKPPHEGAARQMLLLLSGRKHQVLTGYHLRYVNARGEIERISKVVTTEVEVKPLSPKEVEGYLRSQEWRGKAGAYAIQGRFSAFVRKLEGSYENVVGLPLCSVLEDLEKAGLLPSEFPSWNA